MLKSLRTKNFKSFEELNIDLRPITILLGPNNAGKSSVLAVFRLLAQTLMSYDSNIPLLLNGSLGDFGTYRDLAYGHETKRALEIRLSATAESEKDSAPISIRRHLPYLQKDLNLTLGFKYRSALRELTQSYMCLEKGTDSVLIAKYSKSLERLIPIALHGRSIPSPLRPFINERFAMYHFMPRGLLGLFELQEARQIPRRAKRFLSPTNREALRALTTLCRPLTRALNNVEYIGPMRQAPLRTYPFSGERHATVGALGEHAVSILSMDALRRGTRTRQLKGQTENWLRKAGIAEEIQISIDSDRYYELQLKHPVTGEYANYADIGYGNSQVIPVLIGGYNLSPGSLYLVEQPELHLHPRAQAELGDFFLELKQNNVQSIIETHSEHLVLRLLQHVAAKHLAPNDIALYYVYPKGRRKVIKRIRLSKGALFQDSWPEGFFPDTLKEAKRLAQLRSH